MPQRGSILTTSAVLRRDPSKQSQFCISEKAGGCRPSQRPGESGREWLINPGIQVQAVGHRGHMVALACRPGPGHCCPLGDQDMKARQRPWAQRTDQGRWSLAAPKVDRQGLPTYLLRDGTRVGTAGPQRTSQVPCTVCVRRSWSPDLRERPSVPSTTPGWTEAWGGPHATCLQVL